MADLETRVAAVEADRMDHRAVLAAINALGADPRDLTARVAEVEGRLRAAAAQETNVRVRSLGEGMAEMKDLLIRALDRRPRRLICLLDSCAIEAPSSTSAGTSPPRSAKV